MIYEIIVLILLPILNFAKKKAKASPKRILLIQVAKIGDYVNSSSIIASLKNNFPEAHLSLLITDINHPLAKCDERIDSIFLYASTGYHGFLGRLKLAKLINKTSSDLVISLNYSSVISTSIALSLTPERHSIFSNKKNISFFITKIFWNSISVHKPERLIHQTYNDLLSHILGHQNQLILRNSIFYNKEWIKAIDSRIDGHKRYIGIGIASGNKLKEIPTSQLIDLISAIRSCCNQQVILIGTADDKKKALEICKNDAFILDAAGDYPLDAIPYLMRKLSIFIGVDSGLTYIADAMDIPVISISGPCNSAETRPLHAKSQVIQNLSLDCMPCSYIHKTARHCHAQHLKCIKAISPDRITSHLKTIINN